MARNFSRLPAQEIALAVGENLTQVCDLLELTLELLNDIGTKEQTECFSMSITKALADLRDGVMQDIFRLQPSLKTVQLKAVREEGNEKKKVVAGYEGASHQEEELLCLSFRDRNSTVMQRQVLTTIIHLCMHACTIEEELSGDSDSEKKLFNIRMAQVLGGPIYDMMLDISAAYPDLAIPSWKPPGN